MKKIYDTILIHEDNYNWLISEISKSTGMPPLYEEIQCKDYYYGINIRKSRYINKYVKRWQFPDTPFVQYDESDEVWARPIRFGREVDTDIPIVYMLNSNFYNPFK